MVASAEEVNQMFKKILIAVSLIALFLLGMVINRNPYEVRALQVKNTQPSTLRVVDGSSEIINGKMVLQPTVNPQQ